MSEICGVICNCGPNFEPLACGYLPNHEGNHSWATLPTFIRSGAEDVLTDIVVASGITMPHPETEFSDYVERKAGYVRGVGFMPEKF